MILVFDQEIHNRPLPNLAQFSARPKTPEWDTYSTTWPYSEPAMLWEYCKQENYTGITITTDVERAPFNSWYLIALSFFDHEVDWFSLMSETVLNKIKADQMRLLFYYSEGDDPAEIRSTLDKLCYRHSINPMNYKMVTANTVSGMYNNGVWFADDEMLYRHRNRFVPASRPHSNHRNHRFTVLSRTNKWWRSAVMADLWHHGVHIDSYFSYDTRAKNIDLKADNPISIHQFPGLPDKIDNFLAEEPFVADQLDSDTHNDHTHHVAEHFEDSYVNIVLETHFDADGSSGAFITEKTFKPIKHGQPFLIFGAPGSLHALKKLGYRVFDDVFNNAYDNIHDNNVRYAMLMHEIQILNSLSHDELHNLYLECLPDIVHNQQLFLASKADRLNTLVENICLK